MRPDPEQQAVATGVERASVKGGVLDQTWSWVEANWLNIMMGVPSIVLTIAAVEFSKEWVKMLGELALKERYDERWEDLLVRTFAIFPAAAFSYLLGFRASWAAMGIEMDVPTALVVGALMTWFCALGSVKAIDYFEVAEELRDKWKWFIRSSRPAKAMTGTHDVVGDE